MVATARGTSATAAVAVILRLLVLSLLLEVGISRSSGGGGRRWAHRETRKGGLVTAVRVLGGLVHGNIQLLSLLLLLRKLEGVDLGVHTTHVATLLESVNLAQLLRLQQSHVYVLLVCSCNLLLLLLKQLDLLLNGQLFHYKHPRWLVEVHHDSRSGGGGHTHQRSQLRGTSPVSNMELAPTGAWYPGLAALLIHDP